MKNETIKTYTEITPLEAMKLLVENEGKPVKGLAVMDESCVGDEWSVIAPLQGVDLGSDCPFELPLFGYEKCATVTELDPCQAPDGCPELEPWMAYLGENKVDSMHYGYAVYGGRWMECEGAQIGYAFAIDVRTAFAQEHFSEHCRIRNYQEPDPFEEFAKKMNHSYAQIGKELSIIACGGGGRSLLREAYELGQANPKPTK